MILAVDIANKATNFGVFDRDDLKASFSIRNDKSKSIDELKLLIKLMLNDREIALSDIDDIIFSSVVPEAASRYGEIGKYITGKNPILIGPGVKTGINIKCESPKEVGTDRIIRAVGASNSYDGDLLVVSASSITTIDYINAKKEFLGGLILPGIDLFEDALRRQSAKLPQVEIKKADKILGNNTVTSIQTGIYKAYQNAVFGIVDEIMSDYKLENKNTQIIVTGDFDHLLDRRKKSIIIHDNLGLDGLRMIYELNSK